MTEYVQLGVHAAQIGLSVYALTWAVKAITNLQQYEEKSEKAAEWSNIAADRLHKTRTTQTSGTLALVASLAAASYFVVARDAPSPFGISLRVGLVGAIYSAKQHQDNFWHDKAMIPLVRGYNQGIKATGYVRQYLGYLSLAWMVSAAIEAVGFSMAG